LARFCGPGCLSPWFTKGGLEAAVFRKTRVVSKKTITLDEKIEKAQEAVEKTKARYDAAVKELRDLLDKKDAQRNGGFRESS